jgi:hypothetical protein
MKFKRSFLFLILLIPVSYLYAQLLPAEISGQITDPMGQPIAYATIKTKNSYGIIADQIGRFKIKAAPDDSIYVSRIGYKSRALRASQQATIILEEANIILSEVLISKSPLSYTQTARRIIKNYYVMSPSFISGSVITDSSIAGKQLMSVKLKIGFRGHPVLPFRLRVYNINKEGLPDQNLLVKDVLIPVTNKFRLIELDLSDQGIFIKEKQIFVGVELLNVSTNYRQLHKNYTPLIGYAKNANSKHVFTSNRISQWGKFKGETSPYFLLGYQ